MYHPVVGRFLNRDPLPSSAVDPYQYVRSNPINLLDPFGLAAAEAKDAAMATRQAKSLEKALPDFIDKLKDAAKNWNKVERGGYILKDVKGGGPSFTEQVGGKKTDANHHQRVVKPGGTEFGGNPIVANEKGIADLTKSAQYDSDRTVEFGWHTHPDDIIGGDPEPSEEDTVAAKKQNLAEFVISYRNMCGKESYNM